jgi:hypothetical protein
MLNSMSGKSLLLSLTIAVIYAPALVASAQTGIEPLREIHLPVPESRGSYSHCPIPGLAARDHFSWRVAPDQSLLVFDSDATGNWPLVRIRAWWTENPVSEVLKIPGRTTADKKDLAEIYVDVQVTPNGRYAVAFSGAMWRDKSDCLFHTPKGYVQRPSDTIITVIDLDRWQVVTSIHTATLGDIQIRGARVVNDRWIAFDDSHNGRSPSEYGAYPLSNALISIPDLKPGPRCVSQRVSHVWQRPPDSVVESLREQNDQACREVLEATGTDSAKALETLIQRGSDVEPDTMKIRILDAVASGLPGEVNLWTAEGHEEDFFRDWGEYPYNENYAENPPLESSSRLWYGLYGSQERQFYELTRYDAEGGEQKSRTARHLMCATLRSILLNQLADAGLSMSPNKTMRYWPTVAGSMAITTECSSGSGFPSSDQTIFPRSGSSTFPRMGKCGGRLAAEAVTFTFSRLSTGKRFESMRSPTGRDCTPTGLRINSSRAACRAFRESIRILRGQTWVAIHCV